MNRRDLDAADGVVIAIFTLILMIFLTALVGALGAVVWLSGLAWQAATG